MKVYMSQNEIKSLTLQHLQGWVEALGDLLDSEDCPFSSNEELALQLDHWKSEFQKQCSLPSVANEVIHVMTYGKEVILICKPETGEFIKLTLIYIPWKIKTSLSQGS